MCLFNPLPYCSLKYLTTDLTNLKILLALWNLFLYYTFEAATTTVPNPFNEVPLEGSPVNEDYHYNHALGKGSATTLTSIV